MKAAKTTADSNALVPAKYNLFFFHTEEEICTMYTYI